MKLVVDASVAVKWLVEEELGEHADAVSNARAEIVVPELFPIEVASALSSKTRQGFFSAGHAAIAFDTLLTSKIRIVDCSPLWRQTLQLSIEIGKSALDTHYLSLAIQENCRLVTADRKFVDGLVGPVADRVIWLGDFPLKGSK